MLDSVYSPFNYFLRGAGLLGPNDSMIWLGPQHLIGILMPNARGSLQWWGLNLSGLMVILVNIWRLLPMSTVIFMAGFTSIPPSIRYVATFAGAYFLQESSYVTVP